MGELLRNVGFGVAGAGVLIFGAREAYVALNPHVTQVTLGPQTHNGESVWIKVYDKRVSPDQDSSGSSLKPTDIKILSNAVDKIRTEGSPICPDGTKEEKTYGVELEAGNVDSVLCAEVQILPNFSGKKQLVVNAALKPEYKNKKRDGFLVGAFDSKFTPQKECEDIRGMLIGLARHRLEQKKAPVPRKEDIAFLVSPGAHTVCDTFKPARPANGKPDVK